MPQWSTKDRIIASLRRQRSASGRKVDIEHEMRNFKPPCKFCGTPLRPYKQDSVGNIIMACPRFGCRGSADMMNSPTNIVDKLWIHQMNVDMKHRMWMDDYGVINRYG